MRPLTGRYRFRTGWLGRQVLQVERRILVGPDVHDERPVHVWTDATADDLSDLTDPRSDRPTSGPFSP